MRSNPYRLAAERPAEEPVKAAAPCDVDLAPLFLFLWICSVARVFLGVSQGETFGTELTLALMAVVGLPFLGRELLLDFLARKLRRRA